MSVELSRSITKNQEKSAFRTKKNGFPPVTLRQESRLAPSAHDCTLWTRISRQYGASGEPARLPLAFLGRRRHFGFGRTTWRSTFVFSSGKFVIQNTPETGYKFRLLKVTIYRNFDGELSFRGSESRQETGAKVFLGRELVE